MITRIVKMEFTEVGVDAFKKLFEQVSSKISNFPDCHHLELVQGEEVQIFFTISRWENTEALEQYRQSALFKATWAKTKILFADRAKAWTTHSIFSSK